jgi:hypothetical protein
MGYTSFCICDILRTQVLDFKQKQDETMDKDDFIFVPASQRNNLDDIINRVKTEKEKDDAAKNRAVPDVLEETLKHLDINSQVSEKVKAMQAELEEKKKSGK